MGWTEEELAAVLRSRQKPQQQAKSAPQRAKRQRGPAVDAKTLSGPFDAFMGLLAANGLPIPEREYIFHPTRRFKADYAWPVHKLIVERQGGVWAKPGTRAKKAHTEPMAILRDYEKNNLAQLAGFRYLQYTPEQLDSGAVIETLKILLLA
jgi:hypothetical protein